MAAPTRSIVVVALIGFFMGLNVAAGPGNGKGKRGGGGGGGKTGPVPLIVARTAPAHTN